MTKRNLILKLTLLLIVCSCILLVYDLININKYGLGMFVVLIDDLGFILYYLLIFWIAKTLLDKKNYNPNSIFIFSLCAAELLPVLYYVHNLGYL